MFSIIKNFLNKRKRIGEKPLLTPSPPPRPDGFQLATLSDSNIIFDMIITEAKNGHFSIAYTFATSHNSLKHQINETIKSKKCPFNGITYNSDMYVSIDNGKTIAFSWVLKKSPTEVELYLMAAKLEKRGQGIGRIMTEESINKFVKGTKFTVRLYKASKIMLKIVKNIGFKMAAKQAVETKSLYFISK
jgi:hypothetical protein